MSHTNPLPELPEPFVHCYEWKDLRNGTRRSFSAAPYNGMRCSNSLALFTAEQFQAVQREAYELGARSTAAQPADAVEQEIVVRYVVEKRSGGGFWPYCVRAGDGARELFVGHKKACEQVRAALESACLDGAFMARSALGRGHHG